MNSIWCASCSVIIQEHNVTFSVGLSKAWKPKLDISKSLYLPWWGIIDLQPFSSPALIVRALEDLLPDWNALVRNKLSIHCFSWNVSLIFLIIENKYIRCGFLPWVHFQVPPLVLFPSSEVNVTGLKLDPLNRQSSVCFTNHSFFQVPVNSVDSTREYIRFAHCCGRWGWQRADMWKLYLP